MAYSQHSAQQSPKQAPEQFPQQPTQPFQHQHRFRVNPTLTYSQRMTSTRAELRQVIKEKLCAITREPNAQMRWSRQSYIRDVVGRYRVRIEGWPLDQVPFKNLSDVPNLGKLELLLAGFRNGTIYFCPVSDEEYAAMAANPDPWIGAAELNSTDPDA